MTITPTCLCSVSQGCALQNTAQVIPSKIGFVLEAASTKIWIRSRSPWTSPHFKSVSFHNSNTDLKSQQASFHHILVGNPNYLCNYLTHAFIVHAIPSELLCLSCGLLHMRNRGKLRTSYLRVWCNMSL